MPVEIKELIIRASVVNKTNSSQTNSQNLSVDTDEIIAACAEQVLKILERKKER